MVAVASDKHESGHGRVEEGNKGLSGRSVASLFTWVFLACSHILHSAVSRDPEEHLSIEKVLR